VGLFGRFGKRGRRGGTVDVDKLAARAGQAGIDPEVVRQILTESRGSDGKIDWNEAVDKAQARGLDVNRLRELMRGTRG